MEARFCSGLSKGTGGILHPARPSAIMRRVYAATGRHNRRLVYSGHGDRERHTPIQTAARHISPDFQVAMFVRNSGM
jgi:hypothetical protein